MKKINLGQTITILANIGVIGGILLLAYELRQNNELLGSQNRFNRLVINVETYNTRIEDSSLAELLGKLAEDMFGAHRLLRGSVNDENCCTVTVTYHTPRISGKSKPFCPNCARLRIKHMTACGISSLSRLKKSSAL